MNIAELNEKFAIPGTAEIIEEKGLPHLIIKNSAASAKLSLMGAHLEEYKPTGQKDLLWMSSISAFEEGKAIRGGIPVCWPWFGKNEQNPALPMHGFARIFMWQLDSVQADTSSTTVKLYLEDSPETRKLWDFSFRLEYTLKIADTLELNLTTINKDSRNFTITQALHTYFAAGDINCVSVEGLDSKTYVNKVGEVSTAVRTGNIVFDREVDQVYLDCPGNTVIHDKSLGRNILITKENSCTYVVWNPWINKSKAMPDFPDPGYQTMLCVETTNALDDARTLAPGESHTLTTTYSLI